MSRTKEIVKRMLQIINGKSYTDLANFLGISRNTVDVWIRRGKVPEKNLLKFCQLTNANMNWLLTGEGEMYVNRTPKNINQGVVIGGVGDNHNYTITTPIEKLPPDVQVIIEELLAMDKDKRKKVLKCILEMGEE